MSVSVPDYSNPFRKDVAQDVSALNVVGALDVGGNVTTVTDALKVNSIPVHPYVVITHKINPANVSGEFIFVADRAYTLVSIKEIHNIVAGQACVVKIRKCTAGGTALASDSAGATCVEFVTNGIDLTATAGVTQTATLAVTSIAAGDKIGVLMGNGTSLVGGNLTIVLKAA